MSKERKPEGVHTTRRTMVKAATLGLGALLVPGTVGTRKAAAATAEESTVDRIKRTGVFNLGAREADPPYGYLDRQGKHLGFSTEIAEKVYERVFRALGIVSRCHDDRPLARVCAQHV